MNLSTAQADLARGEIGGGPGVFISGLAWAIAGIIWMRSGIGPAFLALFIGGALIVPVTMVVTSQAFRAPKVTSGNPLARLGLESSFVLFAGIMIGYAALHVAPQLAFPAIAVTVGARYFAFRTLYGDPLYWLLGGLIASAGVVAALRLFPIPGNVALMVGLIELVFATVLIARWRRRAG